MTIFQDFITYNFTTEANFFPHKIPNIQHTTLNTIYNPPNVYCLLSSKLNASSENVENVVNPPHTPVFQNSTVLPDILSLLLVNPTINPINIAPAIFVISVSIGNPVLTGIRLIAYLAIAPKAPPSATNKKLIIPPLFKRPATPIGIYSAGEFLTAFRTFYHMVNDIINPMSVFYMFP